MMLQRGRGKIRTPRRPISKDGEVDFETTWNILATALHQIHTKNASELSFEELYRNAYKVVLKKKGGMLYDRVSQFEETWLRDTIKSRITHLITPSINPTAAGSSSDGQDNERRIAGERFLKALKDSFEDHQLCMCMITDVLMYMKDRTYCNDNNKPSIYSASMALFRIHVLQSPFSEESPIEVMDVLETTVLDMIAMERAGEVVDRVILRACCYMLEGLFTSFSENENTRLYLTSFEPKFLDSSKAFYRSEGQSLLVHSDASTFCSQARRRLREEEERCQQSLSMLTEPKIKKVVEDELISAHIRDVINLESTGVKNMLDNDRLEDLLNVYDLISRVDPKKAALRDAVQKRVVDLGSDINRAASVIPEPANRHGEKAPADRAAERPINQQTAAAIIWVEEILKLKAKYDHLLEEAFKKDKIIEQALEHSFQDFINANSRSPEHLSLFLDDHLKKGGKGKTEAEIDVMLDNGILLLQYIADKDHFETYYKKHMARRLILKKSIRDMERQMISKMKMKIGNSFTQKLEGLLKDMSISDDLNAQYKESVAKLGDPDLKRIDMEASICTTTVWPFDRLSKADADDGSLGLACVYPAEIEDIRRRYEQFYLSKHSSRQLTWLPWLGDADIRATFKGSNGRTKRHELNVSTYAMIILLLFNDLPASESLSYEEIMAQTNIPRPELIRNLQALAIAPRSRVLRKEPMSKDINPADKFFFNENFTSQFVKLKISPVSGSNSNKVENKQERKETEKRANEERGVAIEAAIVRIMKQRKNLMHHQLMSETLQILSSRFQPDVNMIKKKIEALIDREYLERGPNPDQPSYKYLA